MSLKHAGLPPQVEITPVETERIEQGSVFINALHAMEEKKYEIQEHIPVETIATPTTAPKTVDYSNIYDPEVGHAPGVTIFRIELLYPVQLSTDEIGKFCVSDAYIILNTIEKDSQFEYEIYTWIGSEAETDKRFCCAMFAVALRNSIDAKCKIIRQTESEEDEKFMDLFNDNIELLDASFGTDSGLYMAEEKSYPVKLYKMSGKTRVNAVLHKSKGRILAGRINANERAGKAEFAELEEEEDNLRFWEILEGDRGMINGVFPKIAPDLESHIVEVGNIKKSMLVSDGCYVLDCGVELYLWIGKKAWADLKKIATELFAKVVASQSRPPWVTFSKLTENAESEVFKHRFVDWEGKERDFTKPVKIEKETLKNTEGLKVDVDAIYRPQYLSLCRQDLMEELMKEVNSLLEAFTIFVYQKGKFIQLPPHEQGHFYSQDAYIFLCVYNSTAKALDMMIDNNVDISDLKDVIALNSDANSPKNIECVVYFWQGPRTNKMAYSTFKLSTQQEMENLVTEMYDCKVRIQLVEHEKEPFALLAHLENNYALHFGTRAQSLKKNREVFPKLYQIRTDRRYRTCRAIEIEMDASYLVSNDCFFVNDSTSQRGFLYKGEYTSDLEFTNAIMSVNLIYQLSNPDIEIDESTENPLVVLHKDIRLIDSDNAPGEFWDYFPEKQLPVKIETGFLRVFSCNCSSGFFKIEELFYYTQSNLTPNSCIIVDPGAPHNLFVWIGSDTSDLVRKLVRQSVVIWLKNCNDGRVMYSPSQAKKKNRQSLSQFLLTSILSISGLGAEPQDNVTWVYQGKETRQFKAYFHGWDNSMLAVTEPGNLFSREHSKPSPMLFA
ncbi:hypothetical protein HK103_003427 [Boothiomyces macroporosus]|uniref:Gelsolin-like domain-containing protein n=1 Tax=Boothiomyces macroporosus TaxID=261099 RepID=A0AAD5Y435_9FUNG|nr:hypothetical protein HK103_003427 [Boothiomyces macroporosus]